MIRSKILRPLVATFALAVVVGPAQAAIVAQYSFGDSYSPYPEGHAMRIPAGYYITLEVHYTPNGRATSDLSRVAFELADGPHQHLQGLWQSLHSS